MLIIVILCIDEHDHSPLPGAQARTLPQSRSRPQEVMAQVGSCWNFQWWWLGPMGNWWDVHQRNKFWEFYPHIFFFIVDDGVFQGMRPQNNLKLWLVRGITESPGNDFGKWRVEQAVIWFPGWVMKGMSHTEMCGFRDCLICTSQVCKPKSCPKRYSDMAGWKVIHL